MKPGDVVGPNAQPDLLQVLVVERFLIASDDGWVFRRALSYRGAIQDHNEKESARELLQAVRVQMDVGADGDDHVPGTIDTPGW